MFIFGMGDEDGYRSLFTPFYRLFADNEWDSWWLDYFYTEILIQFTRTPCGAKRIVAGVWKLLVARIDG